MKTQIPIYRAKKIDSDEWVEGFYDFDGYLDTDFIKSDTFCVKVDVLTLAIHFSDIIDSEGTKIFASLSEDGRGGSRIVCDIRHKKKEAIKGVLKYKLSNWFIDDGNFFYYFGSASNIKVTGTKK